MAGTGRKLRRGKKRFVRRIATILDAETGAVVGSQVEWDTGEKRLVWHGEKVTAYRLRPCASVHDWPRRKNKHQRASGVSGET